MQIKKCPDCGSTKFIETITKGIEQKIFYEDGFIVEERTKFSKKHGRAVCANCPHDFGDNYEF